MTRSNNNRPDFKDRTRPRQANLFLSVHYDWNKGGKLLYYASEASTRQRDKELAQRISSLTFIPVRASTQSQHKRLYIDDYKEGIALLWEVDKISGFVPTREYRIEKCLEFVGALKAVFR